MDLPFAERRAWFDRLTALRAEGRPAFDALRRYLS
jgi:hypothetical protein